MMNRKLPLESLIILQSCTLGNLAANELYLYFNLEVHTQCIGVMLQHCYVLVRMNIYCMANHYPSEDHLYFRECSKVIRLFLSTLFIVPFSGVKHISI